jgi:hypothetical protein
MIVVPAVFMNYSFGLATGVYCIDSKGCAKDCFIDDGPGFQWNRYAQVQFRFMLINVIKNT